MTESAVITYSSVPECEFWTIPFWDARDRDEYDDLVTSIRLRGPERFTHAVRSFRRAVAHADLDGVRFYVGQDLPEGITIVLRPDSQQQAAEILAEITGFMAPERGVVPWYRVKAHLWEVREAILADDGNRTPSFGFGALIQHDNGICSEAPTSWLSAQLENMDDSK